MKNLKKKIAKQIVMDTTINCHVFTYLIYEIIIFHKLIKLQIK